MIPSLVDIGEPGCDYLPPGFHDCTLKGVEDVFVYNSERRAIMDGLVGYIALWNKYTTLSRIYLDGSYVTSKRTPSDADVIIIVPTIDHEKPDIVRLIDNYTCRKLESIKFRCDGYAVPGLLEGRLLIFYQFQHTHPNDIEKGILRVEL